MHRMLKESNRELRGDSEMVRTIMSGGGFNSRVVKHDRKGKQEPVTHKGNVAGVAQQGRAVAFEKSPITQGKGYEPKPMASTGIAGARQGHAGAGPGGGGRTIYKSGSQSPIPPAHGMPPGRDTLSEFGPDVPGRRGNR
jgi:hypothetical protein